MNAKTILPPELDLPTTPIHAGSLHIYLHSDLNKAASHIKVCAGSLVRASDCDNDTLWKLEEAYRILANIIDRLDNHEPALTAQDRNAHGN